MKLAKQKSYILCEVNFSMYNLIHSVCTHKIYVYTSISCYIQLFSLVHLKVIIAYASNNRPIRFKSAQNKIINYTLHFLKSTSISRFSCIHDC